jgi:hypothetical protein
MAKLQNVFEMQFKVDKLEVKFNVGPNPTQIYEALNVGDSEEKGSGYHHLKRQLLLKPSGIRT